MTWRIEQCTTFWDTLYMVRPEKKETPQRFNKPQTCIKLNKTLYVLPDILITQRRLFIQKFSLT